MYRGGDGDLLIGDLYKARVVEKSYGHKIELAEDENGHGDRLSALLQACRRALSRWAALGWCPLCPTGRRIGTASRFSGAIRVETKCIGLEVKHGSGLL